MSHRRMLAALTIILLMFGMVLFSFIEQAHGGRIDLRNIDYKRLAKELEVAGNKTAVPTLLERLKNRDANIRKKVVILLQFIGNRTAVPAILETLLDEHVDVRRSAVATLRILGGNTVIPDLVDALKDQDLVVRRNVIEALGEIGDKTAVPVLLDALKDKDILVRRHAAEASGKIGDKTAVPVLLDVLKDKDPGMRKGVAKALGEIGDKSAAPMLLDALKDKDIWVRRNATEALGKIGDNSVIPALFDILKDEYAKLHAHAVLVKIVDKTAIPILLDALQDKHTTVRKEAAYLLGYLGEETVVRDLLKALRDNDSEVRLEAMWALANLGAKTVIPTLVGTLKDEEGWIRERTIEALGAFGDKIVVLALLDALRDKNTQVRIKATKMLGNTGGKTVIPDLVDTLNDENPNVRKEVVEALGKIKDKSTVPVLLYALKDEYAEVRRAAAEALGEIGGKTAISVLFEILKDEDVRVAKEAAKVLGNIGDMTTIPPPLIKALKDKRVRYFVADVLQKIRKQEPLTADFYETSDVFIFNRLRNNLLFSDALEHQISIEEPFLRSATFYLLSSQSRENGNYIQQFEYAEQALLPISPKIETALAILSLWLKMQAELKLAKHQDALQTITQGEALLDYLSPIEKVSYAELFEEQMFFFKGEVFLARGENKLAIQTYNRALEGLERTKRRLRRNYRDITQAEKLEAMIHTGLGIAHKELSKLNLEQAIKLGEQFQSENSLEIESEEKRYIELAKHEIGEGNYERAQELIEELYLRRQQYLNRRMELKLSDSDKQQAIDKYRRKQQQIEGIVREIAQLDGKSQQDEEKVRELEEQRNKAKRELKLYVDRLKRKQPDLAMLLGAKPVELAAVQEQLPEDTALLQYVVLSDKITVFVIKAYSMNIVEIPVYKDDLKAKVEGFRLVLFATRHDERGDVVSLEEDDTLPDFHTLRTELYQLLFKPVVERGYLDDITQVGFAPNNFLHYLPFEALHDGQTYLLDQYQVFYINSTSMLWVALDTSQYRASGTRCLLAFSNPDGSLRYADVEVDQIAPLFASKTVYHRQEAKEELVHAADVKGCVLHFATHGVWRADDSTKSYLKMADGNLTVEEIWGLPLKGAELSTLSACETGLGEILSGDDVISLENAFIYAGSPSVIASLWQVDDEGTSELMQRFYQHVLSGKTKAAALRSAKQDLKQQDEYQHPYYWAAFTLRGVWN